MLQEKKNKEKNVDVGLELVAFGDDGKTNMCLLLRRRRVKTFCNYVYEFSASELFYYIAVTESYIPQL